MLQHKRFDSGPKSVVGTGAYIAPEVIISRTATAASDTYDGQVRAFSKSEMSFTDGRRTHALAHRVRSAPVQRSAPVCLCACLLLADYDLGNRVMESMVLQSRTLCMIRARPDELLEALGKRRTSCVIEVVMSKFWLLMCLLGCIPCGGSRLLKKMHTDAI